MDQSIPPNDRLMYLISFLGILVVRNGGTLEINNLSYFAGTDLSVEVDLRPLEDKVILKSKTTKLNREEEN